MGFVLHNIPKYSLWMNKLLRNFVYIIKIVFTAWSSIDTWSQPSLHLQKHDQHFNKNIFDVMTNYENKQKCVGIFYSNRIGFVSFMNKQNSHYVSPLFKVSGLIVEFMYLGNNILFGLRGMIKKWKLNTLKVSSISAKSTYKLILSIPKKFV